VKIPHVLKIDRETFRVVYGDAAKAVGEPGGAVAGCCDPGKRLITLNANLRTDHALRKRTFFHEVVHALDMTYGLSLGHGQIDRLGQALANFFQDNEVSFPTRPVLGAIRRAPETPRAESRTARSR
jgi:hypothetical protein